MATAQPTPERAALATAGQIMRPPSRAASSVGAPAAMQPPPSPGPAGAAPAASASASGPELTLENLSIDKLTAVDGKLLLQKTLGKEKYEQYWALLKKFLMCRLSKPEFDAQLKRLLGTKDFSTLFSPNSFTFES